MGYAIVDLRFRQTEEWLPVVLLNHPNKPLWWVPGVTVESQKALMEHAVKAALTNDRHTLLGCDKDGRLAGFAELRYIEWDSAHFGFNVFRLENFAAWGNADQVWRSSKLLIQAIIDGARQDGARTIHTWLPMEAIRSVQILEDAGFRTMDIKTTWVFEHAKQCILDYKDRCIIRGYQPGDEEEFVSLAREAYVDTPDRFHSDPHLPIERSNELYAEWIRNSFSGQFADHIVVAELDGKPAGYTTIRLDGDHGGLSNVRTGGMILSAVAPWAQGRGVYTSMVNSGLKWLAGKNVDVTYLGTQVNNYPVQRAWARLGFRLARTGPSMHLWLGD